MFRRTTLGLTMLLLSFTCFAQNNSSQAQLPRLIRFSGTLQSSGPVAGVTFSLYQDQQGGSPLWVETQNVTVDAAGRYSALIGASSRDGLPADLFTGNQARWLGVQVSGEAEQPRVLLVSVPYALKAGDAETLNGLPASAFLQANASGTSASTSATGTQSEAVGVLPAPRSVTSSTGTTNQLAKWTDSTDLGSSIIFDNGTKVGVGTTSPQATLDVNGQSIFRSPQTQFLTTTTYGPQFVFTNAATPTAAKWAFGVPGYANATPFFIYDSVNLNAPFTIERGAGANSLYLRNGGNVGLGTSTPSNKLTVTGIIQSTTGGFMFPDATMQTTAAKGTISGVTAGTGLTGGGTTGAVTLNVDTTKVVTGVTAGPGLTGGGTGGLLTLNLDTTKVVTGVTVGSGITGGGTSGSVSVGTDFTAVQARVTGTCSSGTALASINATGGVSCNTVGTGGGSLTFPFSGTGADTPPTKQGVFAVTDTATGPTPPDNGPPAVNTIPSAIVGVASGSNIVAGVVGEAVQANGVPLVAVNTSTASSEVPVIFAWSQATSGNPTLFNGQASSSGAKGISLDFDVTPNDSIQVQVGTSGNRTQIFDVDGSGNITTNGSIQASGAISSNVSISAPMKNFKIDDPLDPANKWLYHTSIESPDMKDLYDGLVVLDNHGEAWVTMPDWFQALNRDFRYQLTAIGAPGPKLYIAQEVSGNRFKIAGGKRGMKVSWMVTGIRQDTWAADNRAPVEQDKQGTEIGKYYHPKNVTSANSPDANAMVIPQH